MLTRDKKSSSILFVLGMFIGVFIARAITDPSHMKIIDWFCLAAGIGAMILHYLPDAKVDS